jgi:hypothetical protein
LFSLAPDRWRWMRSSAANNRSLRRIIFRNSFFL